MARIRIHKKKKPFSQLVVELQSAAEAGDYILHNEIAVLVLAYQLHHPMEAATAHLDHLVKHMLHSGSTGLGGVFMSALTAAQAGNPLGYRQAMAMLDVLNASGKTPGGKPGLVQMALDLGRAIRTPGLGGGKSAIYMTTTDDVFGGFFGKGSAGIMNGNGTVGSLMRDFMGKNKKPDVPTGAEYASGGWTWSVESQKALCKGAFIVAGYAEAGPLGGELGTLVGGVGCEILIDKPIFIPNPLSNDNAPAPNGTGGGSSGDPNAEDSSNPHAPDGSSGTSGTNGGTSEDDTGTSGNNSGGTGEGGLCWGSPGGSNGGYVDVESGASPSDGSLLPSFIPGRHILAMFGATLEQNKVVMPWQHIGLPVDSDDVTDDVSIITVGSDPNSIYQLIDSDQVQPVVISAEAAALILAKLNSNANFGDTIGLDDFDGTIPSNDPITRLFPADRRGRLVPQRTRRVDLGNDLGRALDDAAFGRRRPW